MKLEFHLHLRPALLRRARQGGARWSKRVSLSFPSSPRSAEQSGARYMKILAIETSCDDTCVAIAEAKGEKKPCFNILSNVVSSQVKIHQKYGGVYPSLAKREHQKNLPITLRKALRLAKLNVKSPEINAVAVTVGPGLEPCLWTGINFAKKLAEQLKVQIIPVNHIEAHIVANFIGENSKFETLNPKLFPAISLVVSGGHTQLILMKDFGNYRILGETRDDAAGECFDKIARILGLGYPGGPLIAKQALQLKLKMKSEKLKIILPRPMIYQKNYDFSFSGLKTAVLYKVRSMKYEETKKREFIQEMCKEAQQAIIDVLIKKTIKAAKDYKAKTIILGGGVAANDELKRQFDLNLKSKKLNLKFLIPPKKFCTDNAVMVAATAYFNLIFGGKRPKSVKENKVLFSTFASSGSSVIEANANLRIKAYK